MPPYFSYSDRKVVETNLVRLKQNHWWRTDWSLISALTVQSVDDVFP